MIPLNSGSLVGRLSAPKSELCGAAAFYREAVEKFK